MAEYAAIGFYLAATASSIYSGVRSNQVAKRNSAQIKTASRSAAISQMMAAQAESQRLHDQASIMAIEAEQESRKAAVAQQSGEIENERRMRVLAADLGNAYAQWAGSNLLVDGGDDSLGHLLSSTTREAAQDVAITSANTANEVWEHQMNRSRSLISQSSYLSQAMSALDVGDANAKTTLLSGSAQAYATRQAGLTALYQGIGSAMASMGGAAMGAYNAGMFKSSTIPKTTLTMNDIYDINAVGGPSASFASV